jgi:phosphoribosylformylglycinamidine synthase
VDLEEQRRAHELIRGAVRDGLLASAHDVSDGGLGVALSECCIAGAIGARIELAHTGFAPMLFGEGVGGFVVSGTRDAIAEVERRCADAAPFDRIGEVGGDELRIAKADLREAAEAAIERTGAADDVAEALRDRLRDAVTAASLSIPVADLAAAFESGIPATFS